MKVKRNNPLSYVGYLGFVGIVGLIMMTPVMIVFLLFFFFFTYEKMEPDELFWNNVRKAGLRGFTGGIGLDFAAVIFFICRAQMSQHGLPEIGNAEVVMDPAMFQQLMLVCCYWVIRTIITLCIFFITLMYYSRQEKKYLETKEC